MADSLKRLVLLAKGAKGAAAKHVVIQALDAPDVHVFGELLDIPSVKELKTHSDHAPVYNLLEIFAYGTYPDYKATNGLPPLSPQQLLKLRLLTIVSLGSVNKIVSYDSLITALDLGSLRELEDIIIEAIYRKLIGGKLDQKRHLLSLDFVIGRDLKHGDLDKMISIMDSWCNNCENLLKDIDSKMKYADECKEQEILNEEKVVKEVENIKATLKAIDKGARNADMQSEFTDDQQRSSRAAKRHMSGAHHKEDMRRNVR